ncbi:putative Uncharacterized 50.6 kDa protein in the 5'region of gyrA and gyrB [Burkholderia vietnamiensis]|nr:putative Uncharacterized 50.6 kDa protein in the 5'region of gyrA and gyrB [Burkholderia vietnamiensis]
MARPRAVARRAGRRPRHRGVRGRARRRRVRRGPSRRSRRAPRRRTVRHARARGRRDRHRSRADRVGDARRRPGKVGPRARHRVRRRDDHLQRHRRAVPAGRCVEARRAGFPGPRREQGAGGARLAVGTVARDAELPERGARPAVLEFAARVRGRVVARAVRRVRVRADGSPSRLLSRQSRQCERIDPRDAAQRAHRGGQHAAAVREPRRRGAAREAAVARRRARGDEARRAGGRRGHRDRRARAVARRARGRHRRAGKPAPDQHEPRARLGARQHRADDSDRRRRVHLGRTSAHARHRPDGNRAAGAHAARQHAHAEPGTHDRPARRRASVAVRRVPVPVGHALSGGPPGATAALRRARNARRARRFSPPG